MNLKKMLKDHQYEQIWQSYCGFLDLDMQQYMRIQNRLMDEQIALWSKCELGQSILKGKFPKTIDEFRAMVPITTYEDYADILLQKRTESLPDAPIIWIQTTWEGGKHPIKVAPYTRSMLDRYRANVTACLILSTSDEKGKFNISEKDKVLYGLAPLPYATGLFPLALNEEIDIGFLPPVKEAEKLSFSDRNKLGFKLAMKKDVEYFFGLGSVVYAVSQSLSAIFSGGGGGASSSSSASSSSIKSLLKCHPKMIYRILKAKGVCKRENRQLMPKDLFSLKGFMVAGTDNNCYKDDLEQLWGVRPMELFAGTEPTLIGTETWTRKGMYFFPDACFYEFISERDMLRLIKDRSYVPRTYLMDEVVPGEKYEIVISVLKGGAFARYRVGDVYRCVGLTSKEDDTKIPRFEYVDRVPNIIDIAGFTRISEHSITSAIALSGLDVKRWTAKKAFTNNKRPYMHLYLEMSREALVSQAINSDIIKEILTTYFKYIDEDYRDLKKILGMDPLVVTMVKCGTFEAYESRYGVTVDAINPPHEVLETLLSTQHVVLTERRV